MAEFWTMDAVRPDLSGIEVNTPTSYIGGKIYPVINTVEKTGTVYYQTLTADSAAQTGRSAGTAPTTTQLAASNTTFSCAEVIKRYGVTPDEAKQLGGMEKADKLGGMGAKRSVMRALEDAQAAAAYTGSPTDISAGIIDGIVAGMEAVKRYGGRTAFVCSHTVYRWLIAQTEVKEKLSYSFRDISGQDIMSINQNVFKMMLQGIFALDEVLIGDDDHWEISGKPGHAAIVKLPDPPEFSHKLDPVLGKTALFLPDGNQPFELSSYPDKVAINNLYTAKAWYQVKQLNAGAKALLNGLVTVGS